jgi:hypothetical protein
MATALQKLRQKAKELGVSSSAIRSANRDELEQLVADAGKPAKKKLAKKATAKKPARKPVRKAAASKPTRSAKKSAPAKSRKSGTAKRQTAQKSKASSTSKYEAKGGRNTLDGVDFSDTEGWNPRPGSAPDRIVKALRKFRGNRAKVFDFLVDDIGDFVPTKRSDGSAWEKGDGPNSRKGMLRYRISRTAWQFAVQTGQHESSTNRVEYGTGGTGTGTFKRAKAGRKATTKAATTRKPTRKSTAKSSARTVRKATAKGTQRKTAAGSKSNKPRRAVRKASRR